MGSLSQAGEALFGVYCGLWAIGLVFFTARSSKEPVKSRNKGLVHLQPLCSLVFFAIVTFVLAPAASTCPIRFFLFPMGVPFIAMPYIYRAFQVWYHSLLNQKTLQVNQPDGDQAFPASKPVFPKHWVIRYRWLSTSFFQFIIFAAYPIAYLVILLPVYFSLGNETEETCLLVPRILVVFQTAFLAILSIFLAYLLYGVKETFNLKLELQLVALVGTPLLILAAILYFIPSSMLPAWLSGENVTLLFSAFSIILSYYLPAALSLSSTHLQSQQSLRDINGKGDVFFQCLQDEKLLKSFEQFCVESFAVENLFFYRHAVSYRHLKGEFQKTEAFRMRHEYISPDSVFEIELSPRIKERILKRIEQGEIDDTLFLEAEQEIYLQMRHAIFPLWKRTDKYREATRGGLIRSRSFFRNSQFVTPVDMQVFEFEKARRRSIETHTPMPNPATIPPKIPPPTFDNPLHEPPEKNEPVETIPLTDSKENKGFRESIRNSVSSIEPARSISEPLISD